MPPVSISPPCPSSPSAATATLEFEDDFESVHDNTIATDFENPAEWMSLLA
eukprot:CAMPEP_0197320506 /NCGR_PEP_ID=MMETSP0891-20130614/60379_1 /TAXON_ID=44058 ORGANISM="Aureoumbra lagunensis, Strain CCMP1510" /NCGR_SAMPLE_ID=MMETSP0891 /ASSEMBLY_ACC=CAM_ASM_000534 /LENGTH=50 /DNA_ID=CAMNT_0042811953 /DNA_START=26 /DNA_END=178 /DNA_ORIENTATION=+